MSEKSLMNPKVLTFYTTKGGVLKTSLALNVSRTFALWGLRVCVIGMDMQGDITRAIGFQDGVHEDMALDDVLTLLDQNLSLADIFFGKKTPFEALQETDLENLKIIPETAELGALNDHLAQRNRREYWLKDKVITPLKNDFDLFVLDCSPNWNLLATNALVASDLLVSPLECKINNFRNLPVFRALIDSFKKDLDLSFDHLFVPTRFRQQVRLSRDIKNWYELNLPNVSKLAVKECALGEEAVALHKSMLEHNPHRPESQEMLQLIEMIFAKLKEQEEALGKASHFEFNVQHNTFPN